MYIRLVKDKLLILIWKKEYSSKGYQPINYNKNYDNNNDNILIWNKNMIDHNNVIWYNIK